jgi:hypothetical protein
MCRRILAVLTALGIVALAASPSAHAQAPTIVTDITFPEEGPPFGTFTASEPLCPSGAFVDEFIGGGGSFHPNAPVQFGSSAIRKHFTCADGSGTFTILFHPQLTPATSAGCDQSGPFTVIAGTGDYALLRGSGEFCVTFADLQETFTGTFRLG